MKKILLAGIVLAASTTAAFATTHANEALDATVPALTDGTTLLTTPSSTEIKLEDKQEEKKEGKKEEKKGE
ncbi:MAG: hypothetical protein ACNA7Y_05655 [Gammaproteobacteria bacterium]